MNLKDVMRQIGQQLDIPEHVIQGAFDQANSVIAPGPKAQEMLERELPDEVAQAWEAYGTILILTCLANPDFKKEFFARMDAQIKEQAKQN